MASEGSPVLLVGSCCEGIPEISNVLKGLLKVDELPSACPCTDIHEYPWRIENKYYIASVAIQHLTTFPAAPTPSVEDSPVEALLVTFDATQASSWESAKRWSSFAEDRALDIRLLLCDQVPSSDASTAVDESQRDACAPAVDRETALQWCIENGFELVEMRPAEEESDAEDDHDEDDFGRELAGVERCVQVLNAHEWTNLVMKERDLRNRQPPSPRAEASEAGSSPTAAGAAASSEKSSLKDLEKLHEGKAAENKRRLQPGDASVAAMAAAGEESGSKDTLEFPYSPVNDSEEQNDDQFGKLFERFGAMKAQAESMEPNERKAYAEKVVMAFWEAMGGDADELEGLDSD